MSNTYKNYNPDILETIANLSNDEVFTPPKLANEILDLLPEEVWSNPNLTFLDPAVKTGIFLREIASRLIDGLADQIPDLQERVNHILTKQVFGIGITELTTLMARRTVYCSTTANGPFSIVTEFDNEEGNIILPETEHTWNKNGRCEYCGANKDSYGGGADRESYAYPFIHDNFKKEFGNMKFDVIIGNPPYQLASGGRGTVDAAIPLYNKFVELAINKNPKYICMITPSRWMKGGNGLSEFREKMLADTRIKEIHDYQNDKIIFPNTNIDGGVSYFLWSSTHKGKTKYNYYDMNGNKHYSERFLKNNLTETLIRDNRQLSIIEKSLEKDTFDSIVSQQIPFGILSEVFNRPENYKEFNFSEKEKSKNQILIYGVKGMRGGAKRTIGYIDNEAITANRESINKYKLFFSKAYTTTATIPPKIILGKPNEVCSQTFLKIGSFRTEKEALNCLSYMNSKFFRALLFFNRHSLNVSQRSFSLIPLQDFSKSWTDEELYKKYKLTQEEIDYIEENIDPMPT